MCFLNHFPWPNFSFFGTEHDGRYQIFTLGETLVCLSTQSNKTSTLGNWVFLDFETKLRTTGF